MPTKKPRIQVALEKPLYDHVRQLAERNGNSLSLEISSLVREALTPYSTSQKPYTGKHSAKWVGRYSSRSHRNDPDEILASQVHG